MRGAPPRRPRAARRRARSSTGGAGARCRDVRAPAPACGRGSCSSSRRSPRPRRGRRRCRPGELPAGGARARARRRRATSAVVSVRGPTRCEPQRSCSFAARSPVSYVPIETCSAPWYEVSSLPAQRDEGGRDRGEQHGRLARQRGERRAPRKARAGASRDEGDGHRRPLEGHPRLGQRALDERQDGDRLREPKWPAKERHRHAGGDPRLRPRRGLDRTVGQPNGGAPGRRPVHEHPVLEGHAAEPKLRHDASVAPATRPTAASEGAPRRARRRRAVRPARPAEAPPGGAPPPLARRTRGRRRRRPA